LPGSEPLQDRVEVPEPPVILVDERTQTRFEEFVVTERATVPANPLVGATVMVEEPAAPTLTFTLVGFADIEKSCVRYVTGATWDRLPLVPVTVAR
jgi:hypothetical protein